MTLLEEAAVMKVGLFCRQCGFKIESIQKEGLVFSISNSSNLSNEIYAVAVDDFVTFHMKSMVPYHEGKSFSRRLALEQFKRNSQMVHCFWSISHQDNQKFTVMSNVPFSKLRFEDFLPMVEEMIGECMLFNAGFEQLTRQAMINAVSA